METGDRLTAEHLIAQGCRHLIHISGVHETAMPADERAAGFCEVCEQKNVQYQVVEPKANSSMFVLPRGMAPAATALATQVAS